MDDPNSDELNVGEVQQTLEFYADRPGAAAIGVGVQANHNFRQLWVFVCDNNHVLKRRVKQTRTSEWGAWTAVSSTPCSGPPTVAGFFRSAPQDAVELFYRSTSGNLIEIYYDSSGVTQEVDVSAETGLGSIAGNPVICDTDATSRFSVAFRDTSNRLKTLTWANGWAIHPATNAAGQQIHADGSLTAMYTTSLAYLSSTLNGTARVLTRSSWSSGFVAINGEITGVPSVLTFSAPTPTSMLVLNRNGARQLTKSAVVSGQPWAFTLANSAEELFATPAMAGAYSYKEARSYANDRGVAMVYDDAGTFTTLWGLDNTQTNHFRYAVHIKSGGTRPVNASAFYDDYVFFSLTNQRLHMINMWDDGEHVQDMGINILVP
jgi:hypothetical protein